MYISEETALVYLKIHGTKMSMPCRAGVSLCGISETQCVKNQIAGNKSVLYGVV